MPVTIVGTLSVEQMLLRLDSTAKKRVKLELVRKAYQLAALAKKMAPRDEGNLEDAIGVRGDDVGARGDDGRFLRQNVEVFIDFDADVPGRPGKKVGDYAYIMHEHLTPAGPLQLGPDSEAKQAGQTERVGGFFLERAAIEIEKTLDRALLDILQDLG